MTYDEPMPHLEAFDVLADQVFNPLQAPSMQPLGRNVAQWADYFADRSIADLIASIQAYNRIQACVDSRTERDQYDWYHTLRNLIICELVYRLGQDVWHWAGRIETPDDRAVKHV